MMPESTTRSFPSYGIIPAAGQSRRMGQPKLKMPWGRQTVIEQVVDAWRRGGVDQVVAVVRGEDVELRELCQQAGATVVTPEFPPPHMKDSVQAALAAIAQEFQPRDEAVWLLAPADMPRLSARVIQTLLDQHQPSQPAILVPTYIPRGGSVPVGSRQRGHPVLFPWLIHQEVARLNEDEGVNVLLSRQAVREVVVDEAAILDDLDTLADYRRLTSDEGG